MICPYCNAELKYEDEYYRGRPGRYINGGSPSPIGYYSEQTSDYKVLGEIYRCPNHSGFEYEEDAVFYAQNNNIEYENWEDIVCESSCFSVSGSFYTNERGDLNDGYPC
jgi:hypothetical protein